MNVIEIKDLRATEADIYTRLNENQAKRLYEPDLGIFICESLRVIERALKAGYEPISFFVDESMKDEIGGLVKDESLPVYVAPTDIMKGITGYSLTGGVLCAMKRKALTPIQEFVKKRDRIVVLDDIENPTNVGAIFRSAAALGADGVVLTEGSADPLYRRAARVSMGTVFGTDWTFCDGTIVKELKAAGFITYALALSDNAVNLKGLDISKNHKRAVILGNEDHGISEEILSESEHVVKIPMRPDVDSLNVAAASAVAFWEIFKE